MARSGAQSTEFRIASEHRWPIAVAVLVALAIYALLPGFNPGLRYTVVGICVALLAVQIVINPTRLNAEYRWSRRLSIALGVILLLANQVALVQLIVELVLAQRKDGPGLLLAAVQVWVVNVIAYSLLYWEWDRGGPVSRRRDPREKLPAADFRFPQDEDDDTVAEVAKKSSKVSDWMPSYLDFLYFSASTSMAFSPTDVMPLSHRAKMAMMIEAFAGFVLLALVIARSVSLLG
jgi:uncharacterized membrane protein